jgi:MFS transporter, YNFM family, putative membrane transport protein
MSTFTPAVEEIQSGVTRVGANDPPVWTVVLAGVCAFLNLYATQPILPLLAETFHVSKAAISLTVLASTLGVALAAPFMGRLADLFGRRRVIVASALLVGVTSLCAATSATLPQLIFWRFLQGVFTPGVFAITVAYINDEWQPGRTGSAMAAYVSGTVVGGFCGRLASGLMAEHAHWRMGFVVLGMVDLAMTAAIWRWLPVETSATQSEPSTALLGAALGHLRNRALLARYATGFCVLFSLVGTFTYVTFYLAAPPFRLSPALLGLIFVVYLFGAAITPLAGRWLDRFGSRRTLMGAASLGMLGVLLTTEPHLWAVAAGLGICCSGVFIAQAAVSSSLGRCARGHRALAVGLYATFYYLGGSAGATLPAWAWKIHGWTGCVALVILAQIATLGIARWFWFSPATETGQGLGDLSGF